MVEAPHAPRTAPRTASRLVSFLASAAVSPLASAITVVLLTVAAGGSVAAAQESPPEATGGAGTVERRLGDPKHEHDECAGETGLASPHGGEAPDVRAAFEVRIGDLVSPYRLMSVFLMPGEEVEIQPLATGEAMEITAHASAGQLAREDDQYVFRAPDSGLACVTVTDRTSGEGVTIHAFVLEPYSGEDVFHGYTIGEYERASLRRSPRYEMPQGLLRLTAENRERWVSPHFQLHQFRCKQETDGPSFLIVRTELLLKLERLVEELAAAGFDSDTLSVMSAYRTPHYNRKIGNTTKYSRHLYGDAADVYIDRDGDGRLDDLDGDGDVTVADAELMAAVVETMREKPWHSPFVGGLGIYGPAPHRGPFIHVDVRGHPARW